MVYNAARNKVDILMLIIFVGIRAVRSPAKRLPILLSVFFFCCCCCCFLFFFVFFLLLLLFFCLFVVVVFLFLFLFSYYDASIVGVFFNGHLLKFLFSICLYCFRVWSCIRTECWCFTLVKVLSLPVVFLMAAPRQFLCSSFLSFFFFLLSSCVGGFDFSLTFFLMVPVVLLSFDASRRGITWIFSLIFFQTVYI